MSVILTPVQARNALAGLPLTGKQAGHASELVSLLGTDGRAQLSTILNELFDDTSPASAAKAISRRIDAINDAARAAGSDFTAVLTPRDKAGSRWLQFESPEILPPPPRRDELNQLQSGGNYLRRMVQEMPVLGVLCFNDQEFKAIVRAFEVDDLKPVQVDIDGVMYYRLGFHGGAQVVLRQASQGQLAAQEATYHLDRAWRCRAVIACGIGFGIDTGSQSIGDVLASSHTIGYEMQRLNGDGSKTPRGLSLPASPTLTDRLMTLRRQLRSNPAAPKVLVGGLLSGDKLIDDANELAELLALYKSPVIGGDMESFGIAHAVLHIKPPRLVDWIAIKGISDFAQDKNVSTKEADQRQAALSAATVLRLLVDSTPTLFPTDPATSLPDAMRMSAREDKCPTQVLEDLRLIGKAGYLRRGAEYLALSDFKPVAQDDEALMPRGGTDVDEALMAWVHDNGPTSTPLCVLLGEFGMGKTITCQHFTQTLLMARRNDVNERLPLYFDLRLVTGLELRVPSIDDVLEECSRKGWQTDGEPVPLPRIWDWIRRGALVIFDGLDEVLSRIGPADGQAFTSSLLSVIRSWQPGDGRAPKVLISCRTHYFSTLEMERNHFTGEQRGGRPAGGISAMVLLPLTTEQILGYLTSALSKDEQHVTALLSGVHDLRDLAQRPYMLRLLAEVIPTLELGQMQGRRLRAVDVYRYVTRSSLKRDTSKTCLELEDKLDLLAELAAIMWRARSTSLPVKELHAHFARWLTLDPTRAWRYHAKDPEILLADLRNSTLLSRTDRTPTDAEFRFSHTSQSEYFLAQYLFAALRHAQPENWDLPTPSQETLDFLGQLLAEAEEPSSELHDPNALATLRNWVMTADAKTNTLVLRYVLRQRARGDASGPVPSLRGINLAGANLDDLHIDGRWSLDLTGADFTGARVRRAILDGCNLTQTVFARADLAQSFILNSQCKAARFGGATLRGATLRHSDISGTDFTRTCGHGLWAIDCMGSQPAVAGLPGIIIAPIPASKLRRRPKLTHADHTGPVNAVAWSPDGTTLATVGDDGTVRLWDPATGQTTTTLTGHTGPVYAVAWSPDGTTLATAGQDGTVRLWDPATRQTHLRLEVLPSWPTPADSNAISWDADDNCLWATPNAWRFLVRLVPGSGSTPPQTLPAEYFGALPS